MPDKRPRFFSLQIKYWISYSVGYRRKGFCNLFLETDDPLWCCILNLKCILECFLPFLCLATLFSFTKRKTVSHFSFKNWVVFTSQDHFTRAAEQMQFMPDENLCMHKSVARCEIKLFFPVVLLGQILWFQRNMIKVNWKFKFKWKLGKRSRHNVKPKEKVSWKIENVKQEVIRKDVCSDGGDFNVSQSATILEKVTFIKF